MEKKRFNPLALRDRKSLKHVAEEPVVTTEPAKIIVKKKIEAITKEKPVEEDSGSISTAPTTVVSKKPIITSYDIVAKEFLCGIDLPEETRSYKPVAHKTVIEDTERAFKDAGFGILKAYFTHADEGKIMSGQYYLQLKGDAEKFGHVVSVQNSYNKRVTLKFAYGIVEWETDIGILSNEISFKRKHTGTVATEFRNMLDTTIYMLTEQRDTLMRDVEMLKFTKIKEDLAQKLMGKIFFNDIVTSSQLNTVRREFKRKKDGVFWNVYDSDRNFIYRETTIWKMYSAVAEVLKGSHAANQIDNFIAAHEFISKTFGLI